MKYIKLIALSLSCICLTTLLSCQTGENKTVVEIQGEQFFVNGTPTYEGRIWNGHKIEGLLINSRMVQGIFDDMNPDTRTLFGYPDTEEWDPDRNTREFVASMEDWKRHGLNSFTLNLQGGSPTGYGNKEWVNSAFYPDGELRSEYMDRLKKILDKADELEMVVMLGIFYFGQDQNLNDETAIINAVENTVNWIFDKGFRNVLIEINNESNIKAYDHEILKPDRVHELIDLVKGMEKDGYRLLVSTSYGGNFVPKPNVVKSADYILIHGNGVDTIEKMEKLIRNTRAVEGYRTMPVVINEDDHYDFDQDRNNFTVAIENYVSWGFFDFRRDGEAYAEGFQSVPVDWGINSQRKKDFFRKVSEITGSEPPVKWDLNVEGFSRAYYDKERKAIAINTVEHPTDEWAAATKIFEKETGIYTIKFTSLLETDGESSYIVKIDGQKVMGFTNPRIYGKDIPDYEPNEVSVKDISVKKGSVIQVEFLPHSNNMVEEGEGFAFARARWKNDIKFISQ